MLAHYMVVMQEILLLDKLKSIYSGTPRFAECVATRGSPYVFGNPLSQRQHVLICEWSLDM